MTLLVVSPCFSEGPRRIGGGGSGGSGRSWRGRGGVDWCDTYAVAVVLVVWGVGSKVMAGGGGEEASRGSCGA